MLAFLSCKAAVRRRSLLAGAGLASVGWRPAAAAAEADEATRRWILALHRWALPRYADFTVAARALAMAVEAGDGQGAIESGQQAWRQAMRAWRRLEALQSGPTLQRRSSRRLDFWPTRPTSIEAAVRATAELPPAGAEADRAMARLGVAVRGLPALEWMLFPEMGRPAPWSRSAEHRRYAKRVADELVAEGLTLHEAWSWEARRWETAGADELQRGMQEVLNLYVGSCELLRGKKLQKAARIVALGGHGASLVNAFDSARSGQTKPFFLTHLEAWLELLVGPVGDAAPQDRAASLTGLLAARGLGDLAAPMVPAAQAARRASLELPADPAQWSPARVEPMAKALRDMRELIDPPIAQALNVTITFTDADGD